MGPPTVSSLPAIIAFWPNAARTPKLDDRGGAMAACCECLSKWLFPRVFPECCGFLYHSMLEGAKPDQDNVAEKHA